MLVSMRRRYNDMFLSEIVAILRLTGTHQIYTYHTHPTQHQQTQKLYNQVDWSKWHFHLDEEEEEEEEEE